MTNENEAISVSSVGGDYSEKPRGLTLKLLIIDSNVRSLPNNIGDFFPNLHSFGVIRSKLEFVRRKCFNRMDLIKFLDLRKNRISRVPGDAFADLVNLKKIDFSGNLIKFLPSTTFKTMPHLMKFIANENLFENFDGVTFRNNLKLEDIHFWHNSIKSITRLNLKRFRKLTVVDLRENVCIDVMFYLSEDSNIFSDVQREIDGKCQLTVKHENRSVARRPSA